MQFLGFNGQGDLGPYTTYTSKARKKLVYFDRAPPLSPASFEQGQARDKFRGIANAWRMMSPEQKRAWHRVARENRLRVHGFGLFTYYNMRNDIAMLRTLLRRSTVKESELL